MSISIKLEPQDLTPVYNPVMLVLNSAEKDEVNFSYIVEIWVDGVYVDEQEVYSNVDGFGVMDLHSKLESYISYDLDPTDNNLSSSSSKSSVSYNVVLYEKYLYEAVFNVVSDDGNGVAKINYILPHYYTAGDVIIIEDLFMGTYDGRLIVTDVISPTEILINQSFSGIAFGRSTRSDGLNTKIPSTITLSKDKVVWNGVLNWVDVPTWDHTIYNLNAPNKLLLCDIPLISDIRIDDRLVANIYLEDVALYPFSVILTTSDGGEFQFYNSITTGSVISVGLGCYELLNSTTPPSILSGSLPVIKDSTESYSIRIVDDYDNDISEIYQFNIKRPCTKFENYKLLYLDKFGGWQSINFDLSHKRDVSVKKTTFNKTYGSYDEVTNTWGYNSWDRSRGVLDTEINEVYSITSNWVNEPTRDKILAALKSPEVYHIKDNNIYLPIVLTTTSLEAKQKVNNKIFNYKLKFEYGFNDTVQRG